MRRVFGKAKPKAPEYTLDDASTNIEKRGNVLDAKIAKLDEELARYKSEMKKKKKGSGAYKNLQKRALRVLKQKKMYEKQRDATYNQQFNIDQTKYSIDSAKDNAQMVSAMKNANKELKQAYKDISIDEVEDLQDDMEDLMEMGDEINEMMGRQYGVPDDIDEEDLLDELDELSDYEEEEEIPSYMVNAGTAKNLGEEKKEEDGVKVDEFGLPMVPSRQLA